MPITIAEANRKVIKYTAIFSSAAVFAYWVYWNWYGHPSSEKRKELEQELQQVILSSHFNANSSLSKDFAHFLALDVIS